MTKCAHEMCFNEAENGIYCVDCIQEPRKECSFCNYLAIVKDEPEKIDLKAETTAQRKVWVRDWTMYGIFMLIVLWVIFAAFWLGWIS